MASDAVLAAALDQRCARCRVRPPAHGAVVAAADYRFPWDRLVARLKYGQQPELAGPLAELLALAVHRWQAAPPVGPTPAGAAELVLPVPLSDARLRERGYNQAWELARRCARRLGLPAWPDALQRWRDTPHQVGADRRTRQANLRDAFGLAPGVAARLSGRHVAVVDDVLTTGATADAVCATLQAHGAASVQLWVLCRTPAPEADDGLG